MSNLPLSVLLVDDNQHMRALIREILRSTGMSEVHEAADAVAAFEMLKSMQIDILVVDYSMPIIDGVEFIKMIRTGADSPNPFLPIIMLTGHSERNKVFAARDAGVTEFMVKPITAKGLMTRLAAIVERPRPFVRAGDYFGPDRRRSTPKDFNGPWRRKADDSIAVG